VISDTLGRPLHNLRISVTDRCNLRCQYCMPEEEYVWLPREDVLHFEEISVLVDIFAELGVHKVRLTGGEPLLRRGLPALVRMLAAKPPIRDLAMTTNGLLLGEHARALLDAGLHRVTVSLDTLRPERFKTLTRRDAHQKVLEGIDAAVAVGFKGLKLDVVVMRAINDDELVDLVEYGKRVGAEVRFIEYMDVGGATLWSMEKVVSRTAILGVLERYYGRIEPVVSRGDGGRPDGEAPEEPPLLFPPASGKALRRPQDPVGPAARPEVRELDPRPDEGERPAVEVPEGRHTRQARNVPRGRQPGCPEAADCFPGRHPLGGGPAEEEVPDGRPGCQVRHQPLQPPGEGEKGPGERNSRARGSGEPRGQGEAGGKPSVGQGAEGHPAPRGAQVDRRRRGDDRGFFAIAGELSRKLGLGGGSKRGSTCRPSRDVSQGEGTFCRRRPRWRWRLYLRSLLNSSYFALQPDAFIAICRSCKVFCPLKCRPSAFEIPHTL